FSLNTFNVFNALFQNRETYIHILAKRSEWMLKQMAMCFLKTDALNNITINSMVSENILPILSIKVGDPCRNLLDTLDNLQILNPEITLSKEARKKFNNLNDLCLIFNLDDLVNNVKQEWLDLPNLFNDEHVQNLSMLTVENMWKEIFSYEVTKKRNRISTKTVAATCKIRSNFQAHGVTKFCADSTHVHLHDKTNFSLPFQAWAFYFPYDAVHRCKYNLFHILDV
ncbi:hypothetical protein PV328_011926, partial [Microctonus aethiopoides]